MTQKNKGTESKIIHQLMLVLVIVTGISVFFAECMTPNTASVIGGALSAFATVVLGFISLKQNENYKRQGDKYNTQIKNLYVKPDLYPDNIYGFRPPSAKDGYHLYYEIASDQPTYYCEYQFVLFICSQPLVNFSIADICYFKKATNEIISQRLE